MAIRFLEWLGAHPQGVEIYFLVMFGCYAVGQFLVAIGQLLGRRGRDNGRLS